jgi:hypothetical protein
MWTPSCTTSPRARQHPGRRPSHAVSRSYAAVVVSPGAPWHHSARSLPTPCARAFRSTTPVHGVVKFAEGRRQRRLTNDEYRQLGRALKAAEVWKPAIAATWLMILTGWRRGEVPGLRWSEIDLPRRTARLADTETGASLRPLSELACSVIQSQPMIGDVVLASRSGEMPIVGYRKMWLRIAKLGDLPADVTPHVLRHTALPVSSPISATTSRRSPACRAQDAQHHQQAPPFRRCRVVGSSRCRGECYHEADDLGSSATPVAGSAARWISRAGRIHLFIGVFVTHGFGGYTTSATASAISRVRRIYLFIGDSVPHDVWDGGLVPAGDEQSRRRPDHIADPSAA